ncbi:energy-coupling factor transport system substrate-specific component [Arcanobacterium pluranimalium]|uniref:MptD family putative ECF transporter S component n=1 Tax=Arcanobacterium pluranimalium TaxID=108028 RepID=UPI001956B12D|nr:MptD family putative ECF transporter S component [Arcanobacterium pluranimalium]MBM7825656.1 energy-coupling factor transport system substrate-specific component [Arcanobacterium pluranimalium]
MPEMTFSMSPKDLINIGVFLVLYFIAMSLNALAAAGPVWIYLALVISAPLGGIVFQLFLSRVKHGGMIFLFGIIFGVFISMIHGWPSLALVVICAVITEVIIGLGKYRSKHVNFWAYPVFQLWALGPIIPIWLNAEEYRNMLVNSREKSLQYAQDVIDLSLNPMFIALIALGIFIFSIVGSAIGQKMLTKHFKKAGIA